MIILVASKCTVFFYFIYNGLAPFLITPGPYAFDLPSPSIRNFGLA